MPATLAELCHTISAHSSDINAVTFSTDALATCSSDKTVRLWSLDTFSELPSSPLCGHTYSVHCCAFSPSGDVLASCSVDGRCILWSVKTGEKLAVLQHSSKGSLRVCRFSSDGTKLATGSDDETLCIWDLASKTILRSLEGHEASILTLAFSPDSAFIVSGSNNGDFRIWDAKYGHGKYLFIEVDAHDLGVTCCDFSPTYGSAGSKSATVCQIHFLLVTGGNDNLLKLWDVIGWTGSGKVGVRLRDTLAGHDGPVMACSFSSTGRLLSSGSGDKTVRLWDPLKGEPVHVIEGHTRYVTSCAFSTDCRVLASGSNDKHVNVWKLTSDDHLNEDVSCTDILVDLSDTAAADSAPPDHSRPPVSTWTVDDVCQWICELGMSQYEATLRGHAIDGQELLTLNQDSLQTALKIAPLGHRNKILRAIERIQDHPSKQPKLSDEGVPDEYLCPITREVMNDPVIASDGYTYERAAITSWMRSGKMRSPMTNSMLPSRGLTPNRSLKMLIQRYSS